MNTSKANLSFWLTDKPTPIADLPSAEQLLVEASKDFDQLYIKRGVKYKVFLHQALNSRCSYAVNERVISNAINHLVAAYSRVYDVLKSHRKRVIEAFSRKSSFDTEAALNLLNDCELRHNNSNTSSYTRQYPDDTVYERLAECANRFGLFSFDIVGDDLISLRDGEPKVSLRASNMQKAVYFLSLLGVLRLVPYQWKEIISSSNALIYEKTGKAPSRNYLYSAAERKKPDLYIEYIIPKENPVAGDFYEKITAAVLFCLNS